MMKKQNFTLSQSLGAHFKGPPVFNIDTTLHERQAIGCKAHAGKKHQRKENVIYSFEEKKETGPYSSKPEPMEFWGDIVPGFEIFNDIVDWSKYGKDFVFGLLKDPKKERVAKAVIVASTEKDEEALKLLTKGFSLLLNSKKNRELGETVNSAMKKLANAFQKGTMKLHALTNRL